MYRIVFSRSAEKDLDKIPSAVVKKIGKSIDTLATEPRPQGCKNYKHQLKIFGGYVLAITGSFIKLKMK